MAARFNGAAIAEDKLLTVVSTTSLSGVKIYEETVSNGVNLKSDS